MPSIQVTPQLLTEDAVFVLQCLRENRREGRSNHIIDVKATLANSVTLDFAEYLKFLRKHNYVTLDREDHTIGITSDGEKASQGEGVERLRTQISEHFSDTLALGEVEVQDIEEPADEALPERPDYDDSPSDAAAPPPPPPAAASRERRPPPPPPPPPIGQTVDEKYPRGDALGSGGVGTVYKARHLALELDVALKELRDVAQLAARVDPSTVARRLETELRAQAALRHPGIVPILDLDCNRPRPYCVMELMPGGNLRQKIDAGGGKPLPVERAMRWFVQVAEALAFAHRAGVTHGNLKPENVLFDALGNARLGDFGMQRLVETAGEGGARVFLAGGGVAYLAPEQVAGTVKDAVRADIYSLGILLYEILAGKVPGRRAPDPSKANSDAPSALDEVFDLMTQDAPDDRYEKLQDVLADIYGAFPDRNIGGLGDLVLFSGPNDEPEKSAGGKRKR